MRPCFSALLCAATFSASVAVAQEDAEERYSPAYHQCAEETGVTLELLGCIAKEHQRQDALLNVTYKIAMAKRSDDEKAVLRNQQRAWIKARDAQCASAQQDAPSGSTRAVLARPFCELQMTTERVVHLENLD